MGKELTHATSKHDKNCHCVECRPLERPCDCSWCHELKTSNKLTPITKE